MSHTPSSPARVAALLLAFSVVGCNASTVTGGENEENEANEVRVTVQAKGAGHLDADDGIRYHISTATQYEGLSGLADILVGDVVEIEFQEIDTSPDRLALEVEADGADDD